MEEKDLKGKKENAGNLDMRAEILEEEGGMFGPLGEHRSNSYCWHLCNKNHIPLTWWAK